MKYRNRRTGAVIEIQSMLRGGDWEAVETRPPAKKAGPRKSRKKEGTGA